MEPRGDDRYALRSLLHMLLRRAKLILLVIAVAVVASGVFSYRQDPAYAAEVRVLLQERSTESLFGFSDGSRPDQERRVATEIEVIKSEPVRDAVGRRFGRDATVSISGVGKTDMIRIRARSSDPRRAAAVARAYATEYIEFRREQAIQNATSTSRRIEEKVADLEDEILAIESQIAEQTDSARESALEASRDSLVSQQAAFARRLDELQVGAQLETGDARIVASGRTEAEQVAPTPVRSALIALAVGAALGLALAFLVESLDDSIKTKDELLELLPQHPVLALIPRVDAWKSSAEPFLATLREPDSPGAEAYRSLRTALQFIGVQRAPVVYQVTSCNAKEGKTSLLSNLAVVLSSSGQRVAIVDADMRCPRLHEFFGAKNDVGLSSVFLGTTEVSAAIQPVAGLPNLSLLSAGPPPPDPAEMLADVRTRDVLNRLASDYDLVLVDSPPVLPVSDPLAVSIWVDATILVIAAGATSRGDLSRTVELTRQASVPVIGVVLNNVRPQDSYGQYGYGYTHTRPGENRAVAGRADATLPALVEEEPGPSAPDEARSTRAQ